MKCVIFESLSTPDAPGYVDKVAITNGDLLFHSAASVCPNPRKPWVKGGADWRKAYGWMRPGRYRYKCIDHHKYGKCLIVNDGQPLPARYPNPNHGGALVVSEIFVHKGWSATWRGSAGCLTIPPAKWLDFISHFSVGEQGDLNVADYTHASEMAYAAACTRSRFCPLYNPKGGAL